MRRLVFPAMLCAAVLPGVCRGCRHRCSFGAPDAEPGSRRSRPSRGPTPILMPTTPLRERWQFPLAAPAGKDSRRRSRRRRPAPSIRAVDPATWKYGHAFDAPPGAKIWNPVKLKMMQGGK